MHLSDISWNDTGEQAVRDYQKGQEVTTVVLAIDPERERISRGIKQLEDDPFNDYVAANDRGTIVTGTVVEVTEKDAIIKLAEEVEGVLRASELSQERVEDARNVLKAGDEIEVKITAVDRKNRTLNLSVKAKDIEDEREAMEHKEREQIALPQPPLAT